VIHLAAAISVAESMTDPAKYERVNYGGSQKVLDWVRRYNADASAAASHSPAVRKVVAASSAAIYGDPDPGLLPLAESAPYGGKSPYADTKYRMEGLMRDFVDGQNDDGGGGGSGGAAAAAAGAVALRFFNVYGPRQDPRNPYSGVISLFLEMARGGKDISILGDGEMTRDFVYVKDVARAIVLAMLKEEGGTGTGASGGATRGSSSGIKGGGGGGGGGEGGGGSGGKATFDVYNVCTGKSITINTLAEQVRSIMGSKSRIVHADMRAGDIRESRCDPRAAKAGMGFVAAVNQEAGLGKTAAWFKSQK
jgi:UDP-glucose 4-epimerase